MTRGKRKARSTGIDRGGYHKVERNKTIESMQCPTMKQVSAEQVPIVQPPIEQVPIVQPPIEQVPIVQLSIEQVPIVELPIEQSPVVDRPPSYVAEEDHLESEEPSMTNTQQENAYLQVRSQPRISPDGRTYLESLRDSAIRKLTKIIKKYFHGPWATWEGTPTDVKDRWFGELEKKYIWEDRFYVEIKRLFEDVIGPKRHKSITFKVRKDFKEKNIQPSWINNDNWDALKKIWLDPKYLEKSATYSKNRLSNKDGHGISCHAGGSIPYSEHKRKYEAMSGREARPSELFFITHKSKGSGNFVDKKSKVVWEKFESEIKESVGDISNEEDVNVQASGSITIEKEASLWNKVVGGPRKGRIYGFGEGSIISCQIAQSIPSQGSGYVPNNNEDSFEQMKVMHEEAEKVAQEKREKEEMQRKIENLETIVQQLLAKNGMNTSSNDPPTSGSNLPE